MGLEDLVLNKVFTWREGKDNKLFIYYNKKQVMILKGFDASSLLADLYEASKEEEQYLLARITGNFKRGNERLAKENLKKYR